MCMTIYLGNEDVSTTTVENDENRASWNVHMIGKDHDSNEIVTSNSGGTWLQ